jgi:putative ABC transport system permease protein
VGQTLLIKNKEFSVVGVLKPSSGDDQNDSVILMSIDRLYGMTEEPHLVSLAVVKAREGTDVIHLSNRIEKTLASRGIRDFTVQSSQQLYDIIGNILRIVQVALASIAAIALLVGGIGLSNTMYTAVLERIREIGLFKSLGAKRHHILVLFLLESALLGFMGGLLGLIGGLSISQSVAIFASQAFPSVRFSAGISPELLLGSLLISVVLGAIAGLWPAMRAARLDPIEALRYE